MIPPAHARTRFRALSDPPRLPRHAKPFRPVNPASRQIPLRPAASAATSAARDEIVVYQPDDTIRLEVRVENETVWLSQSQLCDLFGVVKSNVSYHLKNVFDSGELDREATVQEIRTVQTEGNRRVVRALEYFNLDVIISLGYRINSRRGIQFRQWATQVLKDYLLRGYAVNDRLDRLERKVARHDEQIGIVLRTALPPVEGVLFEGQICDAYVQIPAADILSKLP